MLKIRLGKLYILSNIAGRRNSRSASVFFHFFFAATLPSGGASKYYLYPLAYCTFTLVEILFFTIATMVPAFIDGDIQGVVCKTLKTFTDARGWLTEVFRSDEWPSELHPTMVYISETLPGVARGPHEHKDQTDYFAFIGPGNFLLYLWDARPQSPTFGHRLKLPAGQDNKQVVIVPPGVVHAYQNVGSIPGWVFNGPNRLYAGEGRREPVDEIRHEKDANSPYLID